MCRAWRGWKIISTLKGFMDIISVLKDLLSKRPRGRTTHVCARALDFYAPGWTRSSRDFSFWFFLLLWVGGGGQELSRIVSQTPRGRQSLARSQRDGKQTLHIYDIIVYRRNLMWRPLPANFFLFFSPQTSKNSSVLMSSLTFFKNKQV